MNRSSHSLRRTQRTNSKRDSVTVMLNSHDMTTLNIDLVGALIDRRLVMVVTA